MKTKKTIPLILLSMWMLWIIPACNKIDSNSRPDEPQCINPPNFAKNIDTNTTLSWSCTDPDGDPLTYDVSLKLHSPISSYIVNIEGYKQTSMDVGPLSFDGYYVWSVTAHDNQGHFHSGGHWYFTTRSEDANE